MVGGCFYIRVLLLLIFLGVIIIEFIIVNFIIEFTIVNIIIEFITAKTNWILFYYKIFGY